MRKRRHSISANIASSKRPILKKYSIEKSTLFLGFLREKERTEGDSALIERIRSKSKRQDKHMSLQWLYSEDILNAPADGSKRFSDAKGDLYIYISSHGASNGNMIAPFKDRSQGSRKYFPPETIGYFLISNLSTVQLKHLQSRDYQLTIKFYSCSLGGSKKQSVSRSFAAKLCGYLNNTAGIKARVIAWNGSVKINSKGMVQTADSYDVKTQYHRPHSKFCFEASRSSKIKTDIYVKEYLDTAYKSYRYLSSSSSDVEPLSLRL